MFWNWYFLKRFNLHYVAVNSKKGFVIREKKKSRCNIIFLINLVVMPFMQDVRFTNSSLAGASNSKVSRLSHLNALFTSP